MPMPHRTQLQVIRRRLQDKEGSERIRELRQILEELPGYRNGPYADLRKWVEEQLVETRARGRAVHRDSITVRRQGAAQIALVGAPNAGKSSLLQALSDIQIETGDYAFTTTRPLPAVIRAGGVLVQLVEIPGLLEGASVGVGGGRALLSVLRTADAVVLCHAATSPSETLATLRSELAAAAIDLPATVVITKADEVDAMDVPAGAIAVSILDDASLDRFRDAIWELTGLLRVFLRHGGEVEVEPIALPPPATVADVAHAIHSDIGRRCRGGRIWGSTAKFAGQRVGPGHEVADGDIVEVLA